MNCIARLRLRCLAAALGLVLAAPGAWAQVVVADGVTLAVPPDQLNGVSLGDGATLRVGAGGTVSNAAGSAVIDTTDGTTIIVNNQGAIISPGGVNIDVLGSTLFLGNSGDIVSGGDGIVAGAITSLTNSGAIVSGVDGIASLGTITSLTNSGDIVSGGDGIVAGAITSLTNSGVITSGGDGVDADTITGLHNSGTIDGNDNGITAATITSLHNSGTIVGNDNGITATTITSLRNSGTVVAGSQGISATTTIAALSNSGTIIGGIDGIVATTIASLSNTGTIIGGDNGVNAQSIASLSNSGTITGGDNGIRASNNIASLSNTGTISGGDNGVSAGTINNLRNSGTITGGDNGIFAGVIDDITNSGTISGGIGILAGNIASLTNSGTIIGNGGTAILEGGGADTRLTLLAGSNIQGLVDLGGGVNSLIVGNGLNMATTFAALPQVIDTRGAPFAVSGTTVAVADPTGFGLADDLLADTTGAISDVLAGKFGGSDDGAVAVAMGNGTRMTVTPVADTGTARAWAEVFGGWRDRAAEAPTVGSQHAFGGIVAGIDGMATRQTRLGAFIGGATGEADIDFDAQQIESESVFGGLYASHQTGSVLVAAAVTVGLADHDSQRLVANNQVAGGIETAKADYDGVFVSPEITVSTAMALGSMTVTPSLRLRYAGLWLDGYAESGSAANLTVDDRDVHVLEARAQLAIPLLLRSDDAGMLRTELRLGVDGRTSTGSDGVDAVLFGQSLAFDPGGADEVATGFAAAAFAMAFTGGVTLTGALEAGYGSDDTAHAAARLGARVAF